MSAGDIASRPPVSVAALAISFPYETRVGLRGPIQGGTRRTRCRWDARAGPTISGTTWPGGTNQSVPTAKQGPPATGSVQVSPLARRRSWLVTEIRYRDARMGLKVSGPGRAVARATRIFFYALVWWWPAPHNRVFRPSTGRSRARRLNRRCHECARRACPELHPRLTVGTGFGWLPLTAHAVVGIHRPNGKAGARATPFKASTACPGGGDLIRLSSVCTQIPSTARKKRVRWLASPLLSSKL